MLTRCRLKPVVITEDLKQSFLQIRINKDDREAIRFQWIKDREMLDSVVLPFICLIFGHLLSPFVLEDTIKHHLERYEEGQAQTVMELQ